MSMNVYVELHELERALRFIEVSVISSEIVLDQDEYGSSSLVIDVRIKRRHQNPEGYSAIGELEQGPQGPKVRFGRAHQQTAVNVLMNVGVPFEFY